MNRSLTVLQKQDLCACGGAGKARSLYSAFHGSEAGEDRAQDWLAEAIHDDLYLVEADLTKRRWVEVSPPRTMEKMRTGNPVGFSLFRTVFILNFLDEDFDPEEAIPIPLWCGSVRP